MYSPDSQGSSTELPSYLPPDAVVITGFHEFNEALRSPAMRPEPAGVRHPIMGDTLMALHGAAHTARRRVLNEVVRLEAIRRYHSELLTPIVADALDTLNRSREADGPARADLVVLSASVFTRFAASLVGLEGVKDGVGEDRLRALLRPIIDFQHINYLPHDPERISGDGLAAKERYRYDFFLPAHASGSARHDHPPGACPVESRDLMGLLVDRADPMWNDQDLALRETLVFLIGAIDTSTHFITQAVDEISRWRDSHPDQAGRLEDLRFIGRAALEALRLHPAGPVLIRYADREVRLASGRTIPSGSCVVLDARAAARDQTVFGSDAATFDPARRLPPGVPTYTTSFGSGPHQCIGLRIVLGEDGIGGHVDMLRMLFRAGIEPDRSAGAERELSEREFFETYPVLFIALPAFGTVPS